MWPFLCLAMIVGQGAGDDPHPDRTLFLGPLVRLLDDRRVHDWLEVSAPLRDRLAKSAAERDAARERLERLDPAARRTELEERAAARQQAFVWQLAGELGEPRMRRLVGLALRQWGDAAAFAIGAAERLNLAADQKAEFRKWRAGDPQALPPAKLVTEAQRTLAVQWLGTAPGFVPELRLAAEEQRAAAKLLPHDLPLRLDPLRAIHLLHLEEVAVALRVPLAERRALRNWAAAALKEEADAAAPSGLSDTVPVRQIRVATLAPRFAAESAERLGTERAKRFAELRRQLAGWGGAFGDEHRGELGISPGAVRQAFAAVSTAVDQLHDSPGGFNPSAARQTCDATLQQSLSAEQRQRWQRLSGAPFPNDVLNKVRRAAERD